MKTSAFPALRFVQKSNEASLPRFLYSIIKNRVNSLICGGCIQLGEYNNEKRISVQGFKKKRVRPYQTPINLQAATQPSNFIDLLKFDFFLNTIAITFGE